MWLVVRVVNKKIPFDDYKNKFSLKKKSILGAALMHNSSIFQCMLQKTCKYTKIFLDMQSNTLSPDKKHIFFYFQTRLGLSVCVSCKFVYLRTILKYFCIQNFLISSIIKKYYLTNIFFICQIKALIFLKYTFLSSTKLLIEIFLLVVDQDLFLSIYTLSEQFYYNKLINLFVCL